MGTRHSSSSRAHPTKLSTKIHCTYSRTPVWCRPRLRRTSWKNWSRIRWTEMLAQTASKRMHPICNSRWSRMRDQELKELRMKIWSSPLSRQIENPERSLLKSRGGRWCHVNLETTNQCGAPQDLGQQGAPNVTDLAKIKWLMRYS